MIYVLHILGILPPLLLRTSQDWKPVKLDAVMRPVEPPKRRPWRPGCTGAADRQVRGAIARQRFARR